MLIWPYDANTASQYGTMETITTRYARPRSERVKYDVTYSEEI